MEALPRHLFINPMEWDIAYEDCPLSLPCGQTISQPFIVAKMAELLNLQGNERILEIGSGCGYQSAVLSQLAAFVYGVEFFHRSNRELRQGFVKLDAVDEGGELRKNGRLVSATGSYFQNSFISLKV